MSSKIARFLSAEWLLNKRPNGGGVILARAFICSILLFLFTILFVNVIDPNKTYQFSLKELQLEIINKITWFGIFFATIYAAFYTRFSSQWAYLAELYHSIKSCSASKDASPDVIAEWKAAFIEDAEYLHLARKENFASVILHWGKEKAVRDKYEAYTPGGEIRLNRIMKEVREVYEITAAKHKQES